MNGNYILNLIKHVAVKNYDWKKCLLAISVYFNEKESSDIYL